MIRRKSATGASAVSLATESISTCMESTPATEAFSLLRAIDDSSILNAGTTKAKANGAPLTNDVDQDNTQTRGSLTRQALGGLVANRCDGITRCQARLLVDEVIEEIAATLALGEELKLHQFGSFSVRAKQARPGRNPRTGAVAPVSARRVVIFKAASQLKAAVNGEAPAKKTDGRLDTPMRQIDLERRARFGRFELDAP